MEKRLTPRQYKFITGVLSGLSDANAARQAGYGEHYARKAAMWNRSVPVVKRAIEMEQAALRQQAKYDVQEAVVEIDRAVAFGFKRQNPMSVAKLLELKAKLYGLLIDRVEVATVDMTAALARAETRVLNMIPPLPHGALATGAPSSIDWRPHIPGTPVAKPASDGESDSHVKKAGSTN